MKRTTLRAAMLVAAILAAGAVITGCANTAEKPAAEAPKAAPAFPVTVTDDASRSVTLDAAPERIVSLAPANTEIAYELGLGDKVVGVTTFDDFPAEVKDKPKVGDFMNPNVEAIAAQKPDLVLATGGIQDDLVKKLEDLGATVVVVDPQSLGGLYESIGMVGEVTGTASKAGDVVEGMKAQLDAIAAKVGSEPKTRAFVEIAQNPLYTAGSGTLIDDLLKAAGGENVVTQAGYVAYSLEQLLKDEPDAYLATKGSMSDPKDLAKRAGFEKLAAVKAEKVAVLDDNLVSRPGPRVVLGVEEIAKALHPKAFE